MAVESDPRLAGPGTVRAWEETGIAGSISRRLGGKFCMAYAGLYAVFESLERPALLSLPRSELPKHELLR